MAVHASATDTGVTATAGCRTCAAGRGSCGCAGSTCCSPTGRSMRTRCGRSSRTASSSTSIEGRAWLGIVPFVMEDVGPRGLPAPPAAGRVPGAQRADLRAPRGPARGLVPQPRRREPAGGGGGAGRRSACRTSTPRCRLGTFARSWTTARSATTRAASLRASRRATGRPDPSSARRRARSRRG